MLGIEELSDLERLKLSFEYSISRKHKESLVKRIEGHGITEIDENRIDVVNDNSNRIEQVRFF